MPNNGLKSQFFDEVLTGGTALYALSQASLKSFQKRTMDERTSGTYFFPEPSQALVEAFDRSLRSEIEAFGLPNAYFWDKLIRYASYLGCSGWGDVRHAEERRVVLLRIGNITLQQSRPDRHPLFLHNEWDVMVIVAQLRAFLNHPRMIADPRYVLLMRALAQPSCVSGLIRWEERMAGTEYLTTFASLIACDELWSNELRAERHNAIWPILFCEVALVLQRTSKLYPKETLSLRLQLLRRAATLSARERNSEWSITGPLTRSFRDAGERAELQAIINEDPCSAVAHIAGMILEGFPV